MRVHQDGYIDLPSGLRVSVEESGGHELFSVSKGSGWVRHGVNVFDRDEAVQVFEALGVLLNWDEE